MDQIGRITEMEAILDGAAAAIDAPQHLTALLPQICRLAAYYRSPLWLQDLDDDSAGKLPAGLKRGVLSQDAVHDLLCRLRQMGIEV